MMLSLLRLERKQKKFFKSISNSHIFLFFLTHLELKRQRRSYNPVVPSKTIPDSRPKWAKCILVFRSKPRKDPTRWGGRYLYSSYKVVPPPPPAKIACFAKWVKGAKCILEPQESFLGHSMKIFLGLIGVHEFFHLIFLYANIFFLYFSRFLSVG